MPSAFRGSPTGAKRSRTRSPRPGRTTWCCSPARDTRPTRSAARPRIPSTNARSSARSCASSRRAAPPHVNLRHMTQRSTSSTSSTIIPTPGAGAMASDVASGRTHRAFWSLDRVAEALAGYAAPGAPRGPRELRAIATDTRAIQPSDCFLALRGERFDAHDFLAQAVEQGAAALVVEDARRAASLGVPVFEVPSTLRALGLLGRYRRRAWGKPVVAVAGSNGKTSTKELLKAALGSRLVVHATT